MKNELVELMKENGFEFLSNETNRPRLTKQQKLINHIEREIELINERKDLTLKKVEKNIKGKNQIVNENRFFKNTENENEVFVTLKFKGKILSNKLLVRVNKNKKDVIDMIERMKNKINQIDSKDEFFNQIK